MWGDIGNWDVSGVADFSYAFSTNRDATGGTSVTNGNPKAATFVGTHLSKWTTTSVTTLFRTFYLAGEMNSDLSGWNVAKVKTLWYTFDSASKFTGAGLGSWDTASVNTLGGTFYLAGEMDTDLSGWDVVEVTSLSNTFNGAFKYAGTGLQTWNVAKVTDMTQTFQGGGSTFSSCARRQIANSWAGNANFASYGTSWTADVCPPLTDATFKQASWGT